MTFCQTLGNCQRPGCGALACAHEARSPHALPPNCEGYVPSAAEEQGFGEFEGGGGSGGGGGASGGWGG